MTPRLAYPFAEATRLSGLSGRSLRYLKKTGKLGFVKIGRRVLIPHAALKQLLRRNYVKPITVLDVDESIRPQKAETRSPRA